MPHQVRCPCRGNPRCELCRGAKVYDYTPGDRGWMPFRCPTCRGSGLLDADDCPTCHRARTIDPANPPPADGAKGFFRTAWKILFGG
jgi:DnaJ-class molecular chaperone